MSPERHGSEMQRLDVQGPDDPLRPIGVDRLRALREAIRSGAYPSEAEVIGGLQRMFRWE